MVITTFPTWRDGTQRENQEEMSGMEILCPTALFYHLGSATASLGGLRIPCPQRKRGFREICRTLPLDGANRVSQTGSWLQGYPAIPSNRMQELSMSMANLGTLHTISSNALLHLKVLLLRTHCLPFRWLLILQIVLIIV